MKRNENSVFKKRIALYLDIRGVLDRSEGGEVEVEEPVINVLDEVGGGRLRPIRHIYRGRRRVG